MTRASRWRRWRTLFTIIPHAGWLHRVEGLSSHRAIFTNPTQHHLDFHDSMPDYLRSQKLLFDRFDAHRPAVVNLDHPSADAMVRDTDPRVIGYGRRAGADA